MSFKGITNYKCPVPGADATVYLGHHLNTGRWDYSIWDGNDELIISGHLPPFEGLTVSPEQVARIAFLLEVEYADCY